MLHHIWQKRLAVVSAENLALESDKIRLKRALADAARNHELMEQTAERAEVLQHKEKQERRALEAELWSQKQQILSTKSTHLQQIEALQREYQVSMSMLSKEKTDAGAYAQQLLAKDATILNQAKALFQMKEQLFAQEDPRKQLHVDDLEQERARAKADAADAKRKLFLEVDKSQTLQREKEALEREILSLQQRLMNSDGVTRREDTNALDSPSSPYALAFRDAQKDSTRENRFRVGGSAVVAAGRIQGGRAGRAQETTGEENMDGPSFLNAGVQAPHPMPVDVSAPGDTTLGIGFLGKEGGLCMARPS